MKANEMPRKEEACRQTFMAELLRAAKKGKFIYTNKAFYKFYRFLAKVLPAAWLVPVAKT